MFKYFGLFFVYPMFLYFLFSDKFKNIITLISVIFALLFLSNTFIMVMDYGFIASNFKFELEYLLIPTTKQIILNVALTLAVLFIVLFIIKKNLQIYLFNIFLIVIISLISISIFDFVKINKEQKILSEITSLNQNNKNEDYDVFNFSKTGTNIFIIILDRGCPEFAELVFDEFPDIEAEMEGFVYYYNTVSLAPQTFGSIQALYGGYEYLIPVDLDREYILKEHHNESLIMMPRLFSDI